MSALVRSHHHGSPSLAGKPTQRAESILRGGGHGGQSSSDALLSSSSSSKTSESDLGAHKASSAKASSEISSSSPEGPTPVMAKQARVFWAVSGYMGCSATLLVGNKLAVSVFPAPSFILWAQLAGTVLAVKLMQCAGIVAHCDAWESSKAKAYVPVALIFVATIFTNIKSLEYANVETFMIFRFSTPLAISVCDFLFLGRQLPNARSWTCLFALLAGATGYALTDSHFQIEGYVFCALWYFIFCLDQVYLKHVTNTVKMESNWGRVFYSNLLASIPLLFMSLGETDKVLRADWSAWCVVLATVGLGAAMSYYAWLARSLVSATFFTILGNVCKVISIALNVALWDKHATPFGIACLLFCLMAAYFYKQAPLRETSASKDVDGPLSSSSSENSSSKVMIEGEGGKDPILPK